jgi:serine/threonine-protein kinase SRPK3
MPDHSYWYYFPPSFLICVISCTDVNDAKDIKPDNIMFSVPNDIVFQELEQNELQDPSPRKEIDGRTIYVSSELGRPTELGPPVLCDFGSAVLGNIEHTEDVQPNIYRAPEVILEAPWGYSVDVWNVGCMVRDSSLSRLLYR